MGCDVFQEGVPLAFPAAHSLVCRLHMIEGLTPGRQYGMLAVGVRQLSQRHAHGYASGARRWQCKVVRSSLCPHGLYHGLLEAYEFRSAEAA